MFSFLKEDWSRLINSFFEYFDIDQKFFKKVFFILSIISLILLIPLATMHGYFREDNGSMCEGHSGIANAGRPLAGWLIYFLSSSSILSEQFILNLHPLFLIISFLVLALTGAILASIVFKDIHPFYAALIVSPIIINPFMQGIYVYKVTCLPIILSFLLVTIGFLDFKSRLKNFLFGLFFITLSLFFYQLSINLAIGFVAIASFVRFYKNQKDSFSFFLDSLIKVVLALVIYKTIFHLANFELHGHALNRSETLSLDLIGWSKLLGNVSKGYYYIFHPVVNHSLSMFLLFCLYLIPVKILFSKQTIIKKLFNISFYAATVAVVILSAYGINIVFLHSGYLSRHFLAFSIPMIFCFYVYYETIGSWFVKSRILIVFFILSFLIVSFSYINALKSYQENRDYLIRGIIQNIQDANLDHQKPSLHFDGKPPISRVTENSLKNSYVKRIFESDRDGPWMLKIAFMRLGFDSKLNTKLFRLKSKQECQRYKEIYRNDEYLISFKEDAYLLSFKDKGICYNN